MLLHPLKRSSALDDQFPTAILDSLSEAILVVEARGKKDAEWQFAFGRLNGWCSFRAAFKDKAVWQAEKLDGKTIADRKQPYYGYRK